MEVAAMKLAKDRGMTLVKTGDGWRFSQWWSGSTLLTRPGETHASRAFETPEAAVEYFNLFFERQAARAQKAAPR